MSFESAMRMIKKQMKCAESGHTWGLIQETKYADEQVVYTKECQECGVIREVSAAEYQAQEVAA